MAVVSLSPTVLDIVLFKTSAYFGTLFTSLFFYAQLILTLHKLVLNIDLFTAVCVFIWCND